MNWFDTGLPLTNQLYEVMRSFGELEISRMDTSWSAQSEFTIKSISGSALTVTILDVLSMQRLLDRTYSSTS